MIEEGIEGAAWAKMGKHWKGNGAKNISEISGWLTI